jgi:Sporulation and spore germination
VKTLLALATLVVLGGAAGFVAAGCGSAHAVSLGPASQPTPTTVPSAGTATASTTSTTGTGTIATPISFDVWFARGETLVSARRTHSATPRVATAAVEALLAGPTQAERASGVSSAIPAATRLLGVTIDNDVATVDLTSEYQSGGGSLSMQVRLGQVVYTLTQFPTVKTVRFELDGRPVNVFSSEGIVLDHPVGRSDYAGLASRATPVAGTWRRLAAAPITPDFDSRTAVWTGKELLVFGRDQKTALDARGNPYSTGSVNVGAAYDPATGAWRKLTPPAGPSYVAGRPSAVWTGREMIVDDLAFDPSTNRWRSLRRSLAGGLVVWTGREAIAWGGGCCGDASSNGTAYDPATDTWRKLAASPLAGSQHPIGAWTGKELIVLVGDRDPEGKPWPARLARAAAYDPGANRWRRIASLPAPRDGASAVWDGHELLVVGGSGARSAGFAYDPQTNRWRRLAATPGRTGALALWNGKRLIRWGGHGPGGAAAVPQGLAYDPATDRWSPLPHAPLPARLEPTMVWTGHDLIVWGGVSTATWGKYGAAGAAFTPATQ